MVQQDEPFPVVRPPRICVVLPAYNAAGTLAATLARVPEGAVEHCILVDDCSTDDTVARARDLGLEVIAHPANRGYGGNQKTCYAEALRLGADVVNLDMMLSSRVKGESMLDTIYTLQAMQVDVFVIRDAQAGVTQYVAEHVDPHVSVVSGGEANTTHPTQGLLDALTILQFKGGFRDLVVAIVGDVKHSRVARSDYRALTNLGVGELRLVGPEELMPAAEDFAGAARFESLDEGIDHADVVIMLRIQNERMEQARVPDADRYFDRYGLTAERLRRARPEAIVMHPGPMNRGVEIASDVADGPQSVIRRQVSNGVAVRMAVLSMLAESRRKRS